MSDKTIKKKLKSLKSIIFKMQSAVVAFSGGADSTLLLKISQDVLKDKVLAVIAFSAFMSKKELKSAELTAKQIGCKYRILKQDILKNTLIQSNPLKRCYFCKKHIMKSLLKIAKINKYSYVIEGSNIDDSRQYRPGRKALKELGIRSPLVEAKLNKNDIRRLLRKFKFKNWNKPTSSCLATRFPYNTKLSLKGLRAVAEAEEILKNKGFNQVRVRKYNGLAKIEVEKNKIPQIIKTFDEKLLNKFKKSGFLQVCVDLQGYRSGNMDIDLKKRNN